jgi:N-acetyl-gamma-glutamylphosphate reductase
MKARHVTSTAPKIAIYGASGYTGRQIVAELARRAARSRIYFPASIAFSPGFSRRRHAPSAQLTVASKISSSE